MSDRLKQKWRAGPRVLSRRSLLGGLAATGTLTLGACGNGGLKLAGAGAETSGSGIFGIKKPKEWSYNWSGDKANTNDPNSIANRKPPTVEALMKPGPLGEKSLGNPNASVTVIEYASLTCPYCRAFHLKTYPRFKREFIDTGKIRFILREFPIGRTSGAATLAWRCADGEQYFKLYDLFMSQQNRWVSFKVRRDKIFAIVAQVGMTRTQFDACMADEKLAKSLQAIKQRGREMGVIGTPTFFINGKQYRGPLSFDKMKSIIDPQLSS